MTTILVVHDSRGRRRAIRTLLEGCADWSVVESVAAELDEELRDRPNAVVIELGADSGVDAAKVLELASNHVPVVGIRDAGDPDATVLEAWSRGATFLSAADADNDLGAAVHDAVLRAAGHDPLEEFVAERRLRFELPNEPSLLGAVADEIVALTRAGLRDTATRFRLRNVLLGLLERALLDGNLEVATAVAETPGADVREVVLDRVSRQPYVGRRLHVEARVGALRSMFEVEHEGPPFDLAAVDGGRLLADLKGCFDEVRFEPGRTRFALVKKTPRGDRSTAPVPTFTAPPPKPPVAPPGPMPAPPLQLDENAAPGRSGKARTIFTEELVGDALSASDQSALLPSPDEPREAETASKSKEEPATRPRSKVRIDRDVTDLLSAAPQLDAFGDPLDDDDAPRRNTP